jgi:hypothetical protein
MKKIFFCLTILCALLNLAVDANSMNQEPTGNQKRLGSISGRITIQGKPAAAIELALRPIKDDFLEPIIGKCKTDADGRYKFPDLKSSYYWLQINSEEYVNANGIDKDMEDEKAGRRILVSNGETVTDAHLELALGGMISGRIVDADGKPVVDEMVLTSVPRDYEDDLEPMLFSKAKTDKNGFYTVKGIPPGRYAVSMGENIAKITGEVKDRFGFGADGRVWKNRYFEETFYPGVADKNKAVLLEVALGKELKNINFKSVGRAKTAYSVSGQVIDAKTGNPVKNCELWTGFKEKDRFRSRGMEEKTDENGFFKIDGLLPGEFYVSAYLVDEADSYSEVVTYKITDSDIAELKIHIYPGLTMRGRVVIEGETNPLAIAKLSKLKLVTKSSRRDLRQATSRKEVSVESDGSFRMGGLTPDKLSISLGISEVFLDFSIVRIENPNGLPVQKPTPDDVESAFNSYLLTLDKDLTDVQIVLRYKNVATIKGKVNIIGGKLPANLRLMASFYTHSEKGSMSGSRHVDADGNFSMSNLEPGEYKVQLGEGRNRYGEAKTVKVTADRDIEVSFDLDLRTLNKNQ